MGILAFLGLGAAAALFYTTIYIGIGGHYTGCTCEIVIYYKDIYLFINLGLAIFFLLFSTLILTKHLELIAFWNKQSEEKKETNNTIWAFPIYQLPFVQLCSKISIFCSLAIFALAVAILYIPYDLVGNCDRSECYIYIYDFDIFLLIYLITGVFFSLFSFLVIKKIVKHKQSTH